MKKALLILFYIGGITMVNAQVEPPLPPPPSEDGRPKEVFTVVDEMPEFPGGQDAMYKYLSTNTNYPILARDCDCQGRVFVSFVVDKDGAITDAVVVKGAPKCGTKSCVDATGVVVPCDGNEAKQTWTCDMSELLDKEALRVIKSMPNWKPGKINGKPVKVKYTLPIKFTLT